MERFYIEATTIEDAWFQCMNKLLDVGVMYKIDKGSYEKQYRLEFPFIDLRIRHPNAKLWVDTPIASGIPSPNDLPTVETYFAEYVFADIRKPEEEYTYGQRLVNNNEMNEINRVVDQMFAVMEAFKSYETDNDVQMMLGKPVYLREPKKIDQTKKIIEMYKKGFGTNQAVMEVGMPTDILLPDPPCLRLIDTRVRRENGESYLDFFVYFRSWDLWGGFPTNLAGIEQLKQYIASEINVKNGELLASSKGLHLYDHSWLHAINAMQRNWKDIIPVLMKKTNNDPDLITRIAKIEEDFKRDEDKRKAQLEKQKCQENT
jgi:thymidylate synthase